MKLRALTLEDITITVTATDDDIHPSELLNECMSEDEINALLEEAQTQNVWKWCSVEVKGEFNGLEFSDYLGGCSYESKEEFIKTSGYYEDMCQTVLKGLQSQIDELIADLIVK